MSFKIKNEHKKTVYYIRNNTKDLTVKSCIPEIKNTKDLTVKSCTPDINNTNELVEIKDEQKTTDKFIKETIQFDEKTKKWVLKKQ